jgi:hypothetical protein
MSSTSQRINRGFHRLGVFLAIIVPLVVGGFFIAHHGLSDWEHVMLIPLFLSVAVYGGVRAIGWVISGLAA